MNYININHDGLDERLNIVDENENDVTFQFENSESVIIITKEDLTAFNLKTPNKVYEAPPKPCSRKSVVGIDGGAICICGFRNDEHDFT